MNEGFNAQTPLSDEWCTPAWLFQALDSEFAFTLDGAATDENSLVRRYSSLANPIPWDGERVFCNPPYSDIEAFVRLAPKAAIAVLLLPVRTDSDWFRLLIEGEVELRWFRKRVRFLQNGQPMDSPRFASVVAIVKGRMR